jgi:hypothetical protein
MVKGTITFSREGFDAMGYPVPAERMSNAYKLVKEILPNELTEVTWGIVGKCASYIERDDCYMIVGAVGSLDPDIAKIDLTGRYRLLSVMLTG